MVVTTTTSSHYDLSLFTFFPKKLLDNFKSEREQKKGYQGEQGEQQHGKY